MLGQHSDPLKFACGSATVFMETTIFYFYHEMAASGYIKGRFCKVWQSQGIPCFCLPSIHYNNLLNVKVWVPCHIDGGKRKIGYFKCSMAFSSASSVPSSRSDSLFRISTSGGRPTPSKLTPSASVHCPMLRE